MEYIRYMGFLGEGWSPLDNAAKIFPSTCQKSDTRVFRFSCELTETVDPTILQIAVDKAVLEYPHFLCVMRRGFFWYYLDKTDIKPVVSEEAVSPCSQIYIGEKQNLLFNVTYWKKRINLDIFHVLSDGTGALQFLKTIVNYYLNTLYKDKIEGDIPRLTDDSSASDKADDGFDHYYQKPELSRKELHKKTDKRLKAYQMKYERRDDDDLLLIEGLIPLDKLKLLAKQYNTTITVFLTAVYIKSIAQGVLARNRKTPIIIGIPVNLRNYFPSSTTRNFFSMLYTSYPLEDTSLELADIIASVDKELHTNLAADKLMAELNANCELEHRMAARIAPLLLKDIVLRRAYIKSNDYVTSVVSNIGIVKMHEAQSKYIDHFTVFSSTISTRLTLCSYGNVFSVGYAGAFVNTQAIRHFFCELSAMGLDVELRCNDFVKTEADNAVL